MAKDTMQAVNQAEQDARQAVLRAKEEGEQLVAKAAQQGKDAVSNAVKEAKKKADVLRGVARADAEKLHAQSAQTLQDTQERLKASAGEAREKVAGEIRKIVLGQP